MIGIVTRPGFARVVFFCVLVGATAAAGEVPSLDLARELPERLDPKLLQALGAPRPLTDLQALLDAAEPGATVTFPAGLYGSPPREKTGLVVKRPVTIETALP